MVSALGAAAAEELAAHQLRQAALPWSGLLLAMPVGRTLVSRLVLAEAAVPVVLVLMLHPILAVTVVLVSRPLLLVLLSLTVAAVAGLAARRRALVVLVVAAMVRSRPLFLGLPIAVVVAVGRTTA